MIAGGLVKKLAAAAVVAACAFGVTVALGAALYYALCLVMPPLGAAALTAVAYALVAAITAAVFLVKDDDGLEDEDDEPQGLGARAYHLFRQRPVLGAVAALAGGWIFLRNPALATMVAAAFTEKTHHERKDRRRRRR